MTLTQMLDDMYARLNNPSPVPASVTTRYTSFLNQTLFDVLGRPGMAQFLHGTISVTSVTQQAEYGFPASVSRILSVQDTINQRRLDATTESFYRSVLPDPARQYGTPVAYALLGMKPIAVLPSNPSALFLKSNLGADTMVATVEVVRNDGAIFVETVALAGTTAVDIHVGQNAWVDVIDWSLASPAVGRITMHEDSGIGAELGAITNGQIRSYYQRFALIPTPSAALTYVVDYEHEPQAIVVATDQPSFPARFHRLLPIGARMMEYEHRGDGERRDMARADYDRGLGYLNDFLVNPPDLIYLPGRRVASPSVLPGSYPSSTYGAD